MTPKKKFIPLIDGEVRGEDFSSFLSASLRLCVRPFFLRTEYHRTTRRGGPCTGAAPRESPSQAIPYSLFPDPLLVPQQVQPLQVLGPDGAQDGVALHVGVQ